jgi:uncharacterized protein
VLFVRGDRPKADREDDQLTLVAGISHLQTRAGERWCLHAGQAGYAGCPCRSGLEEGQPTPTFASGDEARIQLRSRSEGKPVHELWLLSRDQGLGRLPAPSARDIFLDLEGDPFARDGGRETAAQELSRFVAAWQRLLLRVLT